LEALRETVVQTKLYQASSSEMRRLPPVSMRTASSVMSMMEVNELFLAVQFTPSRHVEGFQ
jgi:GDP-D-mannose dehydratase